MLPLFASLVLLGGVICESAELKTEAPAELKPGGGEFIVNVSIDKADRLVAYQVQLEFFLNAEPTNLFSVVCSSEGELFPAKAYDSGDMLNGRYAILETGSVSGSGILASFVVKYHPKAIGQFYLLAKALFVDQCGKTLPWGCEPVPVMIGKASAGYATSPPDRAGDDQMRLLSIYGECCPPVYADINGDCEVNILDLILLRNIMMEGTEPVGQRCHADIDGNGLINILDLIEVRNNLGMVTLFDADGFAGQGVNAPENPWDRMVDGMTVVVSCEVTPHKNIPCGLKWSVTQGAVISQTYESSTGAASATIEVAGVSAGSFGVDVLIGKCVIGSAIVHVTDSTPPPVLIDVDGIVIPAIDEYYWGVFGQPDGVLPANVSICGYFWNGSVSYQLPGLTVLDFYTLEPIPPSEPVPPDPLINGQVCGLFREAIVILPSEPSYFIYDTYLEARIDDLYQHDEFDRHDRVNYSACAVEKTDDNVFVPWNMWDNMFTYAGEPEQYETLDISMMPGDRLCRLSIDADFTVLDEDYEPIVTESQGDPTLLQGEYAFSFKIYSESESAAVDDKTLSIAYIDPYGNTVVSHDYDYTAVRPDIDVDVNGDGGIDDGEDDRLEWVDGGWLMVNDDDDDSNGTADNADEEVNGDLDTWDMALVTIWLSPSDLTDGTLTLTKIGEGKVRIFDVPNRMVVMGPNDASVDARQLIDSGRFVLLVEGVLEGEVELWLEYTNGGFYAYDRIKLNFVTVTIENPHDTDGDGNIDDDATAANLFRGNEFTFSTASPGILTIPCVARVTPDTSEVQTALAGRLKVDVSAIGTSHDPMGPYMTELTWDYTFSGEPKAGCLVYNPASQRWEATATFSMLPLFNSDFGLKTATLSLYSGVGERAVDYEVFWRLLIEPPWRFDGNFVKNHPGPDLNATGLDLADPEHAPAPRAPNWFYYWLQAIEEAGENWKDKYRYAGAEIPGPTTPALYYFAGGYTGRHDRVLIDESVSGADPHQPPVSPCTGIDLVRDVVVHENYHAIDQSVKYTNEGFGKAINGASNVTDGDWSFGVDKPLVPPPLPLPAGRVYNHYMNINADQDFSDELDLDGDGFFNHRVLGSAIVPEAGGPRDVNGDGDQEDLIYEKEDLDADGDGVPDWREKNIPGQIEEDAKAMQPGWEDGLAEHDWGNPGKNHGTSSYSD